MKKIINKLFLFLVIFSLGIINVSAENIDPSRDSSLNIKYQYDTLAISNTDVSLYFLANIDVSGSYQFRDSYLDISFDPGGMSSTDVSLKAKEILSYINKNQIPSDYSLKTDQNGSCYFPNLIPGLYLVYVDSKTIGDYRYDASPMLLTIPTLEDGVYQYNVSVDVKTERNKIKQEIIPPGVTDSDTSVPNTLDNIYLYVGLLIISILVIFGVIIYIKKKKGEKDESKK